MSKVQMVATKAFRYAGREIAVDEEFEAREIDQRVLEGLGNARAAAVREVPSVYQTRVMTADRPEFTPAAGDVRRGPGRPRRIAT